MEAWTLARGISDAHCHLQRVPQAAWAAHFARLDAAGVRRFLCCATSPADWEAVARLVDEAPAGIRIVPCFGVHPWFLQEGRAEALVAGARQWLTRYPDAWVGECGLDATRHVPDTDAYRGTQEAAFEAQWKLAAELARPLALHAAGAGAAARLLARIRALRRAHPGVPGGIAHGLVVSPELATAYRKEGFLIGVGAGALLPARLPRVRKMLAALTAEDVCLESDGTDLAAHLAALRDLCASALR